jgi:hypothetical protein
MRNVGWRIDHDPLCSLYRRATPVTLSGILIIFNTFDYIKSMRPWGKIVQLRGKERCMRNGRGCQAKITYPSFQPGFNLTMRGPPHPFKCFCMPRCEPKNNRGRHSEREIRCRDNIGARSSPDTLGDDADAHRQTLKEHFAPHERNAEAFSRLRINKSRFAQEAAKPWLRTSISL